jgi:hypothetical protein
MITMMTRGTMKSRTVLRLVMRNTVLLLQDGSQEERSQKMSSSTQGKINLLLRKETAESIIVSGRLMMMDRLQMMISLMMTLSFL